MLLSEFCKFYGIFFSSVVTKCINTVWQRFVLALDLFCEKLKKYLQPPRCVFEILTENGP